MYWELESGSGVAMSEIQKACKQVCLKGTLFTPLSKHNTSTQSLNVQLRKQLDLHVNIVHGFSVPGLPARHDNLNIIVIR